MFCQNLASAEPFQLSRDVQLNKDYRHAALFTHSITQQDEHTLPAFVKLIFKNCFYNIKHKSQWFLMETLSLLTAVLNLPSETLLHCSWKPLNDNSQVQGTELQYSMWNTGGQPCKEWNTRTMCMPCPHRMCVCVRSLLWQLVMTRNTLLDFSLTIIPNSSPPLHLTPPISASLLLGSVHMDWGPAAPADSVCVCVRLEITVETQTARHNKHTQRWPLDLNTLCHSS